MLAVGTGDAEVDKRPPPPTPLLSIVVAVEYGSGDEASKNKTGEYPSLPPSTVRPASPLEENGGGGGSGGKFCGAATAIPPPLTTPLPPPDNTTSEFPPPSPLKVEEGVVGATVLNTTSTDGWGGEGSGERDEGGRRVVDEMIGEEVE